MVNTDSPWWAQADGRDAIAAAVGLRISVVTGPTRQKIQHGLVIFREIAKKRSQFNTTPGTRSLCRLGDSQEPSLCPSDGCIQCASVDKLCLIDFSLFQLLPILLITAAVSLSGSLNSLTGYIPYRILFIFDFFVQNIVDIIRRLPRSRN